jgi:hypothetical protein
MNVRYDVARVQQALQFLVDSPYGMRHVQRIKALVEKPRAMPFQDEADSLNELLLVGRQSRETLNKLIDVVEFKRRSRGNYQRDFMATKRARERKVIQLESLLRGKNLTLDERNLVLRQYYETWTKQKNGFIIGREPASWPERNEVIREFWMSVDKTLDQRLAAAREQEARVVHRKQTFTTSWTKPRGVLGEKLMEALSTLPEKPRLSIDNRQ